MSTTKLAAEAHDALVEAIAELMERSAHRDHHSNETTEHRVNRANRRTDDSSSQRGALALKEGNEIEIRIADARELAVARKPGRAELLKRRRESHGFLPADFKFDRDEANAG
jgi:antitoxin MazE